MNLKRVSAGLITMSVCTGAMVIPAFGASGTPAQVAKSHGAKKKSHTTGARGPRGKQGKQGPAGPAGAVGATGPAGAAGAAGPAGPAGAAGAAGQAGTKGATGATGATGASAAAYGEVYIPTPGSTTTPLVAPLLTESSGASVTNPAAGVFCISLTFPGGSNLITSDSIGAVATIDGTNSTGGAVAVYNPLNQGCGNNSPVLEIDTYYETVSGTSIHETQANQGFYFLVP